MGKPDIVLIVLDTFRRDAMSYHREDGLVVTPNLDELASRSTVFTHAISPSQWTIPAHVSFFTGLYQYETSVKAYYHEPGVDQLLLAQILSEQGYETIGLTNNHLLSLYGLNSGFGKWIDYTASSNSKINLSQSKILTLKQQLRKSVPPRLLKLLFEFSLLQRINYLLKTEAVKGKPQTSIEDLISILGGKNNKPKFAFLNLMETHDPLRYRPDSFREVFGQYASKQQLKFLTRFNMDARNVVLPLEFLRICEKDLEILNMFYIAEAHYQDELLGKAIRMLVDKDNTYILLVSDHGEMLGEHGLMGHQIGAYNPLIHVPFLVYRKNDQPTVVDFPVSTRRIYHTILSLAGVDPESFEYEQSLSLLNTPLEHEPALVSEAYVWNKTIIAELGPEENLNQFRLTTDRYVAIFNIPPNEENLREIYCSGDLAQNTNLVGDEKAKREVLTNLSHAGLTKFGTPVLSKGDETRAIEKVLSALGYC